jgi:hypothetical protein
MDSMPKKSINNDSVIKPKRAKSVIKQKDTKSVKKVRVNDIGLD